MTLQEKPLEIFLKIQKPSKTYLKFHKKPLNFLNILINSKKFQTSKVITQIIFKSVFAAPSPHRMFAAGTDVEWVTQFLITW